MSAACERLRALRIERALDEARGTASINDAESVRHLAQCDACRAFVARLGRSAEALIGLAHHSAPAMLDGAVVAALQAGHRQERVTRALEELTRRGAPGELERQLADGCKPSESTAQDAALDVAKVHVPPVLDRLVGEDLADQAKAISARYAGRLERLTAPAELAVRLDARLRAPSDARTTHRRAWLAGAAAALMACVMAFGFYARSRASSDEAPRVVLRIEHVGSLNDLDPRLQNLAAVATGGAVDAEQARREEM